MLTLPDKIGVVCLHCKSRHRLTVDKISRLIGDSESFDEDAAGTLDACANVHQEALHVTEVSVDRNVVQFRCRECQAGFQTRISFCETYQP